VTYFGIEATPLIAPMLHAPLAGPPMATQSLAGIPYFGPLPTPTGSTGSALTAPAVAAEAMRQQAAALLQRCYRWLEAAVTVVPQTAGFVPPLVTAVAQYEAQQYDACLAQTAAVITAVRQLQLSVPTLPPL
jgi:hypothetical protein